MNGSVFKKSTIALALMATGGSVMAQANLQTLSSRQSGFTAVFSEKHNLDGNANNEVTINGKSLIVGPVVDDQNAGATLGAGSFSLTSKITENNLVGLPVYEWNQDRTGDGFVTKEDIEQHLNNFVNFNKDDALARVRTAFRELGIQNGWYTWSHEVEVDEVRPVQGAVAYTRAGPSGPFETTITQQATGRKIRFPVKWSSFIMTNNPSASYYGKPQMAIPTETGLVELEAYSANVHPVIAGVAPKLEDYLWGGPNMPAGAAPVGTTKGMVRWRVTNETGLISPAAGEGVDGWNVVDVGNALDRPAVTTTGATSNPFNQRGVVDPVDCLVSKRNVGCQSYTGPTYEEIREATGVKPGIVTYHEPIAPRLKPLGTPADPDEIYDISYELKSRSASQGGFCAAATFSQNYCMDFVLAYTKTASVIDSDTYLADLVSSDFVEAPVHDDASCTMGLEAPILSGTLPMDIPRDWFLAGANPANGPLHNFMWDMRMEDPRAAQNQFPMESMGGDEFVLNEDGTVLGGFGFRGEDSLGPYSYIAPPEPTVNHFFSTPSCMECVNYYGMSKPGFESYCANLGDSCSAWNRSQCAAGLDPLAPEPPPATPPV